MAARSAAAQVALQGMHCSQAAKEAVMRSMRFVSVLNTTRCAYSGCKARTSFPPCCKLHTALAFGVEMVLDPQPGHGMAVMATTDLEPHRKIMPFGGVSTTRTMLRDTYKKRTPTYAINASFSSTEELFDPGIGERCLGSMVNHSSTANARFCIWKDCCPDKMKLPLQVQKYTTWVEVGDHPIKAGELITTDYGDDYDFDNLQASATIAICATNTELMKRVKRLKRLKRQECQERQERQKAE
jgi:hypothetical protein